MTQLALFEELFALDWGLDPIHAGAAITWKSAGSRNFGKDCYVTFEKDLAQVHVPNAKPTAYDIAIPLHLEQMITQANILVSNIVDNSVLDQKERYFQMVFWMKSIRYQVWYTQAGHHTTGNLQLDAQDLLHPEHGRVTTMREQANIDFPASVLEIFTAIKEPLTRLQARWENTHGSLR